MKLKEYDIYVIEGESICKYSTGMFPKRELTVGTVGTDIMVRTPSVSKQHLQIRFGENGVSFADLGSSNGSFLFTGKGFFQLERLKYFGGRQGKNLVMLGNAVMLLVVLSHGKDYVRMPVQMGLSIGRSTNCSIVLDHVGVSRNHAQIVPAEGGNMILRPIGKNGSFVNGKELDGVHQLKDGDYIQILNYSFVYFGNSVIYRDVAVGSGLEVYHLLKKVKGKGGKKKIILNDVSLKIESNDFVAIIGGSGSGKTTLMNAISGFDDKLTGGAVFYNGIDLLENFETLKSVIGYVPQQDIIYENLTLRKMLHYTLKLKSGDELTKEEMNRKIDKVLEIVELTQHQHTYIRKLSGGQKKRASIAVELLGDPSLFFLDEPTSGLDPGTEAHLMQSLQKLAKNESKTVILVTHNTQNLDLCDKVIFMGAGGKICFCGNIEDAKQYFKTDDLIKIYEEISERPDYWSEKYKKTFSFSGSSAKPQKSKPTRGVNYFRQFGVLTIRYAELIKNDMARLILLFAQPVVMGFLMFFVARAQVYDYYEDAKSIFFVMSCAAIWLGVFNSIQEVCKERVILKREYMGNVKIPVYILSKYLIQIIIALVQAAIMLLTFMLTIGLPDIEPFIFPSTFMDMFFVLFMTIFTSAALGLVISSFVKSSDRAMAIAPFALIVQLLFSGILFSLSGFTEVLSFFTVSRWSMEAFGNLMDLNNMKLVLQDAYPQIAHSVESMFVHSQPRYWLSIAMMGIMIFLLMMISMVSLRNISKNDR